MAITIRKKQVHTKSIRKKLPPDERETFPPVINVPAEPLYGDDESALRDEQQVARVETLMTKGIRNKRILMTLLTIDDGRQMDRYMKRVHARWEMLGTTQDHARHRGEGLSRLDLVESEIWSKLQNLDQKTNPQVALNYLSAIINVQKQRNELLGLTPKVIAHIGALANEGLDFSKNVQTHDRLALIASRMMRMIEERTGGRVIEHGEES